MMSPKRLTLLILSLALLCAAGRASAATRMYFDAPASVRPGETFSVAVLLDADRVSNAYSATVDFSGPIQLLRTSNANSIINVWQSNPTASGAAIRFEGGSIEPFAG